MSTDAASALGSEVSHDFSVPLAQSHTTGGAAPLQPNKIAAFESPNMSKMSLFPSFHLIPVAPPARWCSAVGCASHVPGLSWNLAMTPELHSEWPLWCEPPLRVEAIRIKDRQGT